MIRRVNRGSVAGTQHVFRTHVWSEVALKAQTSAIIDAFGAEFGQEIGLGHSPSASSPRCKPEAPRLPPLVKASEPWRTCRRRGFRTSPGVGASGLRSHASAVRLGERAPEGLGCQPRGDHDLLNAYSHCSAADYLFVPAKRRSASSCCARVVLHGTQAARVRPDATSTPLPNASTSAITGDLAPKAMGSSTPKSPGATVAGHPKACHCSLKGCAKLRGALFILSSTIAATWW